MNCGDCKHWGGKRLLQVDLDTEFARDNKKGCAVIYAAFAPDPQPPQKKATIEAYGYEYDGALLATSADFSCSLWEAK